MRITVNTAIGIIFLILGIVLLLANLLGIKISLYRLFPGVVLVILGVIVLFGQFGGNHEVIFDHRRIDLTEPFSEKNVIFAEGIIDLNDLTLLKTTKKIKINIIFGSGKLILNPGIPSVIHASVVFGNAEIPEHSVRFVGSAEYHFGEIGKQEPFLDIEANTIFGQLTVIKPGS